MSTYRGAVELIDGNGVSYAAKMRLDIRDRGVIKSWDGFGSFDGPSPKAGAECVVRMPSSREGRAIVARTRFHASAGESATTVEIRGSGRPPFD